MSQTVALRLKRAKPSKYFHKSMKLATIAANCLGLLPINGNTSAAVKDLSFKWISVKMIYSVLMLLFAFFMTTVYVFVFFEVGASFDVIVIVTSFAYWLCVTAAYLYLAKNWPKLMQAWYEVDVAMNRDYEYSSYFNVTMKIVVGMMFLISTVSFVIDNIGLLPEKQSFHFNETEEGYLYVSSVKIYLNTFVGESIFTDIILYMAITICYLVWTFNEIFLILISTALASRFKQIADRIETYKTNQHSSSIEFWHEMRTNYIRLSRLCYLINKYFSFQITLAFASNTWFVLLDVFFVVKYNGELPQEAAAAALDLTCCMFKMTCTALYAAWVNDESKRPVTVLNSISSANLNPAIEMLLEHTTSDTVALSGNNLFRCTRSLILNIIGAIVAYEVLLIQFTAILRL